MPMRTVNGAALNYEEKGSGPPVVLLHGFPLDCRVFEAQRDALSDRWRVITPDLRGFGASRCGDAFNMESLADDVHALLAEIGALPCVLGGLSMGGYVALAYAKKYPTDLRGLVLTDTRAEGDTPDGRQARDKMIQLARDSGAKAVADQMMPKMLTSGASPHVVGKLREIMEACPSSTIQYALAAMRDRVDQVANLASIAAPTLILVGEQDAITPVAMSQSMHRAIPRSTLEVIPGAGHMVVMERSQEVNQAMRRFLASL